MTEGHDRLIAHAVAAIVRTHDVVDALAQVVDGCARAYPSEAVAVLATDGTGGLELLGSSSHRADALELLQVQQHRGPCVDAMAADAPVVGVGREDLVARWGDVGRAIADAGFEEVHAYPMRWAGTRLGGLNVFVRPDQVTDPSVGQVFADLATIAVLQREEPSADQLVARVREVVAARSVVEQAKGVLAYLGRTSLDSAYAELVRRSREEDRDLTALARRVVDEQHQRPT